jgi:hypothetical protein
MDGRVGRQSAREQAVVDKVSLDLDLDLDLNQRMNEEELLGDLLRKWVSGGCCCPSQSCSQSRFFIFNEIIIEASGNETRM